MNRIATSGCVLLATLVGLHRVGADTHIWDGGSSTSGNWSTPANWVGNVIPSPGDFLVFPNGAARLTNTNNYAPNAVFGGIIFQGDNYNIYGNGVTITSHVTAESGADGNVFRPDLRLGAPDVYLRTLGSGLQLTVTGNIDLNLRSLRFVSQGELRCSGVIGGNGHVYSSGSGKTVFNGFSANTYSGNTYVQDGILELSKYLFLFPSSIKIPSVAVPGNLYIGIANSPLISDVVVCRANNQIASTAQVRVYATGELDLDGNSNTIGYLALYGGHATSGNGLLTVTGNIYCDIDPDGSVISGHLDLGSATVCTVSQNAVLAVNAEISGATTAPLTKQGSGELRLMTANTYQGPTVLQAGTLSLYNPVALGSGAALTTVEGGTLKLVNSTMFSCPLTFNNPATLASSGAYSMWRGDVTLNATAVIDTVASSTLTLRGSVSGPGSLRKLGPGTCILDGPSDNTFGGGVTVQDGTLELAKYSIQSDVIAIPGSLIIGDGTITPGSALVRHGWHDQVADTSLVTVNSDGTWDLNGWQDEVDGLTLEGGWVQTLAGKLTLGGNVQVNASTSPASIGGHLDLGNASHTFDVADGAATYDLIIAATISGGPASELVKDGSGVLRMVGDQSNSYPGATVVNQGMLRLSKLPGLVAVPGDLTIGNNFDAPNTAIVTAHLNESIADASVVTVNASGLLDLNGYDDTIGPLFLSGPASIITSTGTLILGGDITVNPSTGPAVITGNLSLGTATRTFDVADGLDAYDLNITANLSGANGAGWIKEGAGTLRLAGANTFSGPAQVMAGTLHLDHADALGTTAAGTTLGNNTGLSLGLNVTVGTEPLTLGDTTTVRFFSANNTWAGDITLNGHTVFRSVNFLPSDQLELSGSISGPGSMELASGQLFLTGATPNTYAGPTTVSEHTLILKKDPGVIAVPGALIVGNGNSGDTVRLDSDDQIADAGSVQVAFQGLLDLNNHSEDLGSLEGAGDVALGSGSLTTGGNNSSTLFSGVISGSGNVVKTGSGTLHLTGNPSYTGTTSVAGGILQVDGTMASSLVQVHSGAVLCGNGTMQQIQVDAGGAMAPGASPGVLSVAGNVAFLVGEYRVELNGPTAGTGYDQLVAAGQVTLTGSPLSVSAGFVPSTNITFTIVNNTSQTAIAGTFNGLPEGASFVANGLQFEITYTGGDGNDVILTRLQAPAPELTSVMPLSNGSVQVTGLGDPDLSYLIQATDDLVAPIYWQALGSIQADSNGVFDFIDNDASQYPQRFYRSVNP